MVYAFDSTTSLPKTGDAANITAYVSKDYGSVTVLGDTSAAEMDSTNAKGYYLFDLAQAETNANTLAFSAKSSTANIVVVGVPAVVFTRPANFSALSISNGGALSLTTAERDAIAVALLDLTDGVETSHTLRKALRLILAEAAGIISISGSTYTIRDVNDTKNRIVANVGDSGRAVTSRNAT